MAFLLKVIMLGMISTVVYGEDGICVNTTTTIETFRQSYVRTWYYTFWAKCPWQPRGRALCPQRERQSRIDYRIQQEEVPHRLEYCCDGYEEFSAEPLVCRPICTPNCILGNCTSPGVCTCNEGHRQISSYECEPVQ